MLTVKPIIMSDTECDLETLTALLDEDDNDEEKVPIDNGTTQDNSEASGVNVIETKKQDDISSLKKQSSDEGNFDELSALLSDSDDEDDEPTKEEDRIPLDAAILEKEGKKTETEIVRTCNKVQESDIDQEGNELDKAKSCRNSDDQELEHSKKLDGENCTDICTSVDSKSRKSDSDRNNDNSEEPDIEEETNEQVDVVVGINSDVSTAVSKTGDEKMESKVDIGDTDEDFDDFFDSDMEEIVKEMESQSDNNMEMEDSPKSTSKSQERNFIVNGLGSKSNNEIQSTQEKLTQPKKKYVNQSEDEIMEMETEIEDQSDSDNSENLETWFEEKHSRNIEVEGSSSEKESDAEKNEAAEIFSREDIEAELKRMSERMEQLKNLLINSGSESRSPAATTSKSKANKTRATNSKKAEIEVNKMKSAVSNSENKSDITSTTRSQKVDKSSTEKTGNKRKTTGVGSELRSSKSEVKPVERHKTSSNASEEKVKKRTSEDHVEKTSLFSELRSIKPEVKPNERHKISSNASEDKPKKRTSEHHPDKREKHHPVKKRMIAESQSMEDEENPFFAATPSSGDSNILSTDPRSLFGDSDDSDWEVLDEEKKSNLSDEGKEIKKLLNNGPRQRVAHTPKYDPDVLKKSPPVRWTSHTAHHKPARKTKPVVIKPQLDPETGTVSGKYTLREEYKPKPVNPQLKETDDSEVETDPYCGIKIINPRISMAEFKLKMSGRAMIKVSQIHNKASRGDLQKDNWVTIGVVVHRTEPRQSASGKQFCIWKLSDLKDCDKTVSFFLFGNVYKEHWKNELGTVVGLLNPNMMDKAEKGEFCYIIYGPKAYW